MWLLILIVLWAIFVLLNLKALPGAWHLRILHGIHMQTHAPAITEDQNNHENNDTKTKRTPLFKYLITSTRTAPLECDYNGHKSNSTYFSDLDVNRTQLLARLFRAVLSASHYDRTKRSHHLNIALGSTCVIFRREIGPLQKCDTWSRVLGWDGKWVYIVSYFVCPRPQNAVSDPIPKQEDILASGIARYVFKDGRRTVAPQDALMDCGLLPREKNDVWEAIEAERVEGMRTGVLLSGLERLPGAFCPKVGCL